MIPAPAAAVHRILTGSRYRDSWDDHFHSAEMVRDDLDGDGSRATQITSTAFTAPWPVTPRDGVVVRRTWLLPRSDAILTAATSVEHAAAPERSGYVRSRVVFSAVYVRPLDAESCKAIYAVAVDPMGSLPAFIVRQFLTRTPLLLASVRRLVVCEPVYVQQALEETRTALPPLRGRWAPDDPLDGPADDGADDDDDGADDDGGARDSRDAAGHGGSGAAPGEESKAADAGRSPLAAYRPPPSRHDGVLRAARAKAVAAARAAGETDGWSLVEEREGVEIFSKRPPGSAFNSIKGVGDVPLPPGVVRQFFADIERRGLWDGTLDHGRVVRRLDPVTSVTWMCTKVPWPVTSRDCCFAGRVCELADGSLLQYSTSIEDDGAPRDRKFVRSDLKFACVHLSPVDGGARTRVVYAVSADPCGSLPAFVVNKFNTLQPLAIARIRELAASRPDLVAAAEERALVFERAVAAAAKERCDGDGGAAGGDSADGAGIADSAGRPVDAAEEPRAGATVIEWPATPAMARHENVGACGRVRRLAGSLCGRGGGGPRQPVGAVQLRVVGARGVGPCMRTLLVGLGGEFVVRVTATAGDADCEDAVRSTGAIRVGAGGADALEWGDTFVLQVGAAASALVLSVVAAPRGSREEMTVGEVRLELSDLPARGVAHRCWCPVAGLPPGDNAMLCVQLRACVSRTERLLSRIGRAAWGVGDDGGGVRGGGGVGASASSVDLASPAAARGVPAPGVPEMRRMHAELRRDLLPVDRFVRAWSFVRSWELPSLSMLVLALFLAGCLEPRLGALLSWAVVGAAAVTYRGVRDVAVARDRFEAEQAPDARELAKRRAATDAALAKALSGAKEWERRQLAGDYARLRRVRSVFRAVGRTWPPPLVLGTAMALSCAAWFAVPASAIAVAQCLFFFGWSSPVGRRARRAGSAHAHAE